MKKGKELRKCIVKGVEIKEVGNEFHVYGLIGTSHLDEQKDIIPKETWDSFAEQINSTESAGKCGVHHSEVEGVSYGEAEKTAIVKKLSDGEYGLWVDTNYPKDSPVVSKWLDGTYDSFSITYDTNGSDTCEFQIDGDEVIRIIGKDTKLDGYTATDIPANPNAKATDFAFKELKELIKEEPKMSEKKEDKPVEPKEEPKPETTPEAKPEDESEAKPEEPKPEEGKEMKELKEELKKALLKNMLAELKEKKPSDAPMQNAGEKTEPEIKEREKKEIQFGNIVKEMKEKVLEDGHKRNKTAKWKTCMEYKEFLKKNGLLDTTQVTDLSEVGTHSMAFEIKERPEDCRPEFKHSTDVFGEKVNYPEDCFQRIELKETRMGNLIETKAAITTDTDYSGTQTTYVTALANYEQAPARYNDIYGPFIVDQLNSKTTTWNLLAKEDYSGSSSIAVRVRKGRNATALTYGYGSTPGWDSSESLMKLNLGFVTSYVEVQAEWEAMELGNGAGGIDVYQTSIELSTKDLMDYLNGQIFGTGDGTLETASLGFEHLVKNNSAGATTLYGRSRSSNTTLDSGGYENLSTKPFTLDQARKMVETVWVNGAERSDLVFIMSGRQKRLFYSLIQDMQRTVPTSSRIGFTGQIELDAIPVFEDKVLDDGSKTDDIYLIDTRHTRIALKKAPTYVEMAQVSLHRRGIIWMMWNLWCDAPNHNYWTYGAATS